MSETARWLLGGVTAVVLVFVALRLFINWVERG